MADIVIRQIEEGMTGRQVADLLYQNFLALVGAIGSGGGGDIPTADIEKGVTAYGWGDHRQAGYLKGITGGMVTGALGYTPMDEAEWTKANIKATLGIADWALAASKPTYKTSEVTEDGNLYFTDARAVAALAGVTNALAGDIGANATAIGVLQGYFTNGVAKSAAKLQTARKLWGQLFNGTADVTGALTGVTDITASGTLTIGKIKIGDGVIEWDTANGGFKVTGGLWATDYLSSKGVNTGASGGGGGGSSYQRLDTWDGYTSAKDGWVLSAKLGYGLKTTQDDILRQLADISGQGTNVTFTPALTSGTQIGTLTIDGEPVKMYAPSIPTTDIEKGVTAYGWGNHASVGYLTSASSLAWGKITGTPTTISGYGITDAITTANIGSQSVASSNQLKYTSLTSGEDMNTYYGDTYNGKLLYKGSSIDVANFPFSSGGVLLIKTAGGSYTTQVAFSAAAEMAIRRVYNTSQTNWRRILHSENYDDYTYSKSTIDTKLGGYLPLSGGTLTGKVTTSARIAMNGSILEFRDTDGTFKAFVKSYEVGNLSIYNGSTWNAIIHSGNIGSQSVASAAKLTTARTIWGQSFNGENDVSGAISGITTMGVSGAATFGSTLNVTGQTTLSGVVEMGSTVRMVNSKYIYGRTSANVLHNILGVNASDALLVNYGAISQNSKLLTYGSEFRFTTYSDGASVSGATLFYNGKLGVGTSAPEYTADIRGTIGVSGALTLSGTVAATANIAFSRSGSNYITFPTDGSLCLSTATSTSGIVLRVTSTAIEPMITATKSVGTSSKRWGAIYGVDGDFSGTLHATTGIWSDGYVSAKGQNTSSDMRLKRVLEEVTLSVDEIAAAPAVRFAWKGGAGVDVGTSAQYWEKVLPDVVKRDDAGWLTMQYGNAAMVAVIALARRVKELEEQLRIKN